MTAATPRAHYIRGRYRGQCIPTQWLMAHGHHWTQHATWRSRPPAAARLDDAMLHQTVNPSSCLSLLSASSLLRVHFHCPLHFAVLALAPRRHMTACPEAGRSLGPAQSRHLSLAATAPAPADILGMLQGCVVVPTYSWLLTGSSSFCECTVVAAKWVIARKRTC